MASARAARLALWFMFLLCAAHGEEVGSAGHRQQLEARVRQLRDMLKENPLLVNQHLELAMTLQHLNHMSPDGGRRIPEAERAYRQVFALAKPSPALVQVRGNLGALLLSAGRAQDALQELETSLQQGAAAGLPPEELAGVVFNKAKALSMLGRVAEADATYTAAAEAAYGHDFGTYGKALAAMHKPLQRLMDQAQEVAYHGHRLMHGRSGLEFLADVQREWQGPVPKHQDDEVLDWVRRGSSTDLSWLHFALYKYHNQQGNYDMAWRCLEAGNRLMAATTPYSPEPEQLTLARIKAHFSGPLDSSGGFNDSTPIFVLGMPRSGSTLVEQMLGSHPRVFAAGEDTALAPVVGELNAALAAPGADQRALLMRCGRRYVRRMRKLVPHGAGATARGSRSGGDGSGGGSADGDGQSSSRGSSDSGSLQGSAQRAAAGQQPPLRIVDKMLRNVWLIGYIQLLLPSSCIVHVSRHPLDTALSCYSQPFGYSGMSWAWDLDHIAAQINMTWELVEHWEQVLPGRVLTVHYEDLVAHPAEAAREVLQHCRLEWDDAVLHFHSSEGRTIATASMAQVRQPLYNSSVARWRTFEAELAPVRKALGPLIQQYEARLQAVMEQRQARQRQQERQEDGKGTYEAQADDVREPAAKDEL